MACHTSPVGVCVIGNRKPPLCAPGGGRPLFPATPTADCTHFVCRAYLWRSFLPLWVHSRMDVRVWPAFSLAVCDHHIWCSLNANGAGAPGCTLLLIPPLKNEIVSSGGGYAYLYSIKWRSVLRALKLFLQWNYAGDETVWSNRILKDRQWGWIVVR